LQFCGEATASKVNKESENAFSNVSPDKEGVNSGEKIKAFGGVKGGTGILLE